MKYEKLKGDGLTEEDVEDYFRRKKLSDPFDVEAQLIEPTNNVDKESVFKVQREVVDLLQRLFDGENKNVIYVNGFKIVGYKIDSQKLIRVDIYDKL